MRRPVATKKVLALGGGVLVLILVASSMLRREPTPSELAARLPDCFRRKDAGCLLAAVPEAERQAYGLTRSNLQRLLDEYVAPNLKGSVPEPSRMFAQSPSSATVFTDYFDGRRRMTMPMDASLLREGVRSPGLIANILLTASAGRDPDGGEGGAVKLLRWERQAREDGARLTELGFRGVYLAPERGLIPWAEWADQCRTKYERRRG